MICLRPHVWLLCLCVFLCLKSRAQEQNTLFHLLPPTQTGIAFSNQITESDSLNILNQANIYNGGGVGVGDFNNDGLPDLYFAGNMFSNKLYLNKGNLKFSDVTSAAGVGGARRWCTGVSVVDINADGWLDLYISASFRKNSAQRTNLLYINQGLNKDSIPTFKESAAAYGIADTGFSTQGVFFDYDRDGDLDLYLVTNELYDSKTPIRYRPKVVDGSAKNTDRLYRNNGNGSFTNVSRRAGILIEGWGHAVCITDFNNDGWPDVYVANDFISNDLLYINNKNGTFTNRLNEYVKHTGWNAMGTDAVDINNDGLVDLVSLEMLPEDNLRKKTMLRGDEYFNYFNSKKFGYGHQYVRNVLQLNSGTTNEGHPVFSDVGYMAGIYETDWSWAPLVADFDGDGFRDLIITNGLPRDVTDLDYVSYNNGQGSGGGNFALSMVDSLPIVKVANYAFKNTNGLLFENTTQAWGFEKVSFANGGAYADLDNDGDLDVVVNNINDTAFVYENTLRTTGQKSGPHYLSVALRGDGKNTQAIGATLTLYYAGTKVYYEHQPTRGYLSTVDARAYFGLGDATQVDSLRVRWPDAKTEVITGVKGDQNIVLSYNNAIASTVVTTPTPVLFKAVSKTLGINYLHQERDAVDFNFQPTLPHKLSQYGPGIAVGDVDGNGYDDFLLGGAAGNKWMFFLQDAKGTFLKDSTRIVGELTHAEEDMGVLFFDADGDNDLDLYCVSGSYEIPPYGPLAQDRLYINNGKGFFTRATLALPRITANGSCVRAADFDSDGDLDLFVGGRSVSGAYPAQPQSYLLQNESGVFKDVTTTICPELQYIGMISDALWSDFDNDGKTDLVVAGEWMAVTFFRNVGDSLVAVKQSGINEHIGWWNSLTAGDFDNDGDIDYIAGNLGLNSNFKASFKEPMTLYAKDLDENGKMDVMLFCYLRGEGGVRKPYPMHAKDDMVSQLVSIRKKYPTYKAYGRASMDDLWRKQDREGATFLQATNMQSSFIENKGGGKFALAPLPLEAQAAPLFGMLAEDVDRDGFLDLLAVGNDFGMEPGSGRHDALNGLYLKGNGKGAFSAVPQQQSGFFVPGDGKALASITAASGAALYLATQNSDSLLAFKTGLVHTKWFDLLPGDFKADIVFKNGTKRRLEFYYGNTFLSQSSRKFWIDETVSKLTIFNYKGLARNVPL